MSYDVNKRTPINVICGDCGHQHTHFVNEEEWRASLAQQPTDMALALLRELNDALVIPGWLQPRVDAVLDRAEEK